MRIVDFRLPKRAHLILLSLGFILLLACDFVTAWVTPTVQPPAPVLPTSASTFAPPLPTLPPPPSMTAAVPPTEFAPTNTPLPVFIRFAVIGDYGEGNQAEGDVAELIKSWNVDFVITVGDNNYPSGSPETIDFNIGQFYHTFLFPYTGAFGQGGDHLRFFPTLGNHDWDTNRAQAYLDYFELPGNERYYDFVWGPVHFFALDSDSREPDRVGRSSIQAQWLQEHLVASTSDWNLVYAHHPPYSSGPRGPVDWMRWPFREWGATVYLAGHDHFYERLLVDDFPYLINGLGGGPIYAFAPPAVGSQVRFNADYGAMLVSADNQQITFQFITRQGKVIDSYQIVH